ncbi:hypothetical protein TPR58_22115 [Sphingomonas sp. HF-S3]|uniref:Uncharacterized protein n=1 Tax=Sphingomonas rustica TaxID=3103142 RepID=A0ABV0BEG8_9SPHN
MTLRRYEVFADYFQFYLRDAEVQPDPPTDYVDADLTLMVKAVPHLVVIQPVRNMTVPVEIDLLDRAPETVAEGWDQIVEASLHLPSGRLELMECTTGSVDTIDLPPGTYRLRAHFGGLDTLSEDGLDGDDRYRIALWPAAAGPVELVQPRRSVAD